MNSDPQTFLFCRKTRSPSTPQPIWTNTSNTQRVFPSVVSNTIACQKRTDVRRHRPKLVTIPVTNVSNNAVNCFSPFSLMEYSIIWFFPQLKCCYCTLNAMRYTPFISLRLLPNFNALWLHKKGYSHFSELQHSYFVAPQNIEHNTHRGSFHGLA